MNSTNFEQSPVATESDLASTYVSMADDEAVALAGKHYCIHGRVTRLATEKDDTFRVEREKGQRFILKVANPAELDDELAFQIELLIQVANSRYKVPVPQIVADQSGQLLPTIVDRAGQRRLMRLMTYLEGTPLDSTDSSAEERERVGYLVKKHGACSKRAGLADFGFQADAAGARRGSLTTLNDTIGIGDRRPVGARSRRLTCTPAVNRCA